MDRKAQSALEYLMTYGWALVVIAIIIGALVLLLGQSTTAQTCTMSPAAGAIGYVDHQITNDVLTLKLRNDSGKTIETTDYTLSGDFVGTVSGTETINSAATVIKTSGTLTGTNTGAGSAYNGTVTIEYTRDGVDHTATATCTGKAA